MRRRALVSAIVLTLLGGAVVTAVVGIACSTRSWTTQSKRDWGKTVPPRVASVIPPSWLVRKFPEAQGDLMIFVDEYFGFGLEIRHITVDEMIPGMDKLGVDHQRYTRRAGWPCYSLESRATKDIMKPEVIESGIPVPSWLTVTPTPKTPAGASLLPVAVIPIGFAADSLIYGCGFLGLTLVARGMFRAVRVARRRCIECGYDRRGLAADAKCPECGTVPVPASK